MSDTNFQQDGALPPLEQSEVDNLIRDSWDGQVEAVKSQIANEIRGGLREAYESELAGKRGSLVEQTYIRDKFKRLGLWGEPDWENPKLKAEVSRRVQEGIPQLKTATIDQAKSLQERKNQESLMAGYRAELKTLRKLDPTPRAIQFAKINAAWRQKGLII